MDKGLHGDVQHRRRILADRIEHHRPHLALPWLPEIGPRESVALGFLAGGLLLIGLGVMTWHIPVAFLAGIFLTALLLRLIDPAHQAGPFFHLLAGGSMLGAFFFATDPVTAATTPLGKLIYGALAGVIAVFIRAFGSYPDGIGFAILLMNAAAPLIDTYTQPKVIGQAHRRRPGDTHGDGHGGGK